MNIAFIIRVLENRLQSLNNLRSAAINAGDLEKIVQIDVEISETEMTLSDLRNG